MARRVCSIIVIGEGWEDVAFLTGFLEALGISRRQCQPRENPRGGGSGYDFVRSILAEEIRALGRYREGRGVVAMIDEDGKTVEARRAWVADLLAENQLPTISCVDGRCLLIPKRNLETWTYWLTGQRVGGSWAVEEDQDYKTRRPATAGRRLETRGARFTRP